MKNTGLAVAFLAVTALATPAFAKKAPQISALALQQMQSRDYELTKVVSFPAVMTILQDSGFRIQAADKDTGLITATASTKSKMTWAPFAGFGRSKKTPVVSAFIEDRGVGSRVRLNFILAKTKNGAYGSSWSDEEPIVDPAIYRDAFERIDKEIFTRQALNAAAPKPQATIAPSPTSLTTIAVGTPAAPPTVSNALTPNPSDMPSALKPEAKPQ